MAKNKKNKVIRLPQSLDAKIRTRGRNLKIGDCYISRDWETMREGNIVICRVHTNGNLSIGFFLVDLALRGVKDTFYMFNVSQEQLHEIIYNEEVGDNFIEIDYETAHNIIYGAIDYAEQYDFKPSKEFAVAKYLLEEDDDDIPLIDIEFGIDGLPTIICSDDEPKLDEKKHMEKVVGVGNFNVLNTDSLDEDDDKLANELKKSLLPGWDDDIDEIGVPDWGDEEWLNYFENVSENASFRITQYFVDMAFYESFDEDIDSFKYVLGGAKYRDTSFEDDISAEENSAIQDLLALTDLDDSDHISQEIQNILEKFPMSSTINVLVLFRNSKNKDVDDVIIEFEAAREKFHDDILFLGAYAGWLFDNDLAERVPELFNNKHSLKNFNPKKTYTKKEVVEFSKTYCEYYLAIGDIVKAEPYYEVLDTISDDLISQLVIQDVVFEKLNFINLNRHNIDEE